MTELEHPIEWCGKLNESLSLDGFCRNGGDSRRQSFDKSYRPNGAIYIASIPEFRKDRNLYRAGSYAYIMPREKSLDIDTEFDFKLAEFIIFCVLFLLIGIIPNSFFDFKIFLLIFSLSFKQFLLEFFNFVFDFS